MKEGHGREKTESDCFQVTFQSQLGESGPFIENSTYFNIWDGHERSTLRDYQKHIPPRVYWFARHGKQLTPGKTSAKATMVSGDTVYDAGGIRKLKFGSKIYKGMGVCAHTQGCIEGRHGGLQAMEWFRPKFTWVLPAWPPCPFLLRRPGKVSQTFASSCLLTSWVFLFYFFWKKTAHHYGFAVDPTSCVSFSQIWNATKSNWVGTSLLPGKEVTSPEHNGVKKQQLYLCTRTYACTCFVWRHTHTLPVYK